MTALAPTPLLLSLPLEIMQRPLVLNRADTPKTVVLRKRDIIAAALELNANDHGGGVRVTAARGDNASRQAVLTAGLLVGDVILSVGGDAVTDPSAAFALMKRADLCKLWVAGGTRRMRIASGQHDRIGITTKNREDGPGVTVTEVVNGSVAELDGLAKGDIILAVDGTLAIDHSQAMGIVRSHLDRTPTEDIELTVKLQPELPAAWLGSVASRYEPVPDAWVKS